MTTDLIFDFFGTLVQYTPGPFHTAPYSQTHDFLLGQGFALPYEEFTTAFEIASHELEERARQRGSEYHGLLFILREYFYHGLEVTDFLGIVCIAYLLDAPGVTVQQPLVL